MDENYYPKNGRIGRFIKIVMSNLESSVYRPLLRASNNYEGFTAAEKSLWWKEVIEKMENKVGYKCTAGIMNKCGDKCCGAGQRKTARRLFLESGSVEEFLKRISKHDVKEGDLTYTLVNKSTIVAEHNKCFCRQVSNSPINFNTKAYCQCSVRFNKQFFEHALGHEVDVELTDSIICGSKSCKFIVTIRGARNGV